MKKTEVEQLENTGMMVIGNEITGEERTVIVVGTPRSGTSMISGILDRLGLFMGDRAVSPVYEDHRLCEAFEGNSSEDPTQIIEEYNQAHTMWGFKRPDALNYLDRIHSSVKNPVYIVIFRDIFAIANRNRISMQTDIFANMKRTLREYKTIVSFLEKNQPRAMLISNAKILKNKEQFIRDVNEFCSIHASEKQIDAAMQFVSPNPKQYLESSRITKTVGTLDNVSKRVINGWAKYVHNDKPVDVTLYINDVEATTVPANKFRADLKEKGIHPTGNCGFEFILEHPLPDGAVVRVKATHDIRDLRKSPHTFIPASA